MSFETKVYKDQDGDRQVVASGGTLQVDAGATLKVFGSNCTATGAELSLTDGMPADITFAAAAGGANVAEVTLVVVDASGTRIAGVFNLDVWLSDAATGAGLTATDASGTVTAKASSGTVLGTYTAKKALRVQTPADGTFVLEITDAAKTGFYVCAQVPSTGMTVVSAQLVASDYGA